MAPTRSSLQRVFIFDYDGVIVDSLDVVYTIFTRNSKTYNLPPNITKDDIRKLFEKNIFQSLRELGLSSYKIYRLSRKFRQMQLEQEGDVPLFPGVEEFFRRLSGDGVTLAIISSNHKLVVLSLLKRHKLNQFFPYIIGSERKAGKSEKINNLVRLLKVDKENVTYVGDTVGDVHEGKESGVVTVAVTWGYHSEEKLRQASPDFVATSLKALERFLKKQIVQSSVKK